MDGFVYRKTAAGQSTLRGPRAGLTPPLRALLVMVNGRDDAAALSRQLRTDAQPMLDELLRRGLVETVPRPSSRPEPEPIDGPPAAPDSSYPSGFLTSAFVPPANYDLPGAQERVMPTLQLYYGQEAARLARELLAARDAGSFLRALADLHDTLVDDLGQRRAEDITRRIRKGR